MARVLLLLAAVGLTVYALLDIGRTPHGNTRTMPKLLWFVVAFVPILGPVLWLVAGRPRAARAAGTPTPSLRPRRRAPVAPDDDPEFLRRLGDEAWSRRMEEQRRARETGSGGTATPPPPQQPTRPSEPTPPAGSPEAPGPDDSGVTPA